MIKADFHRNKFHPLKNWNEKQNLILVAEVKKTSETLRYSTILEEYCGRISIENITEKNT